MYPNNQWQGPQPSEETNSHHHHGSYPSNQHNNNQIPYTSNPPNAQGSYPPPPGPGHSTYPPPLHHPPGNYPPHTGATNQAPPTLPPVTNMTTSSYLPPPPPQHPDMHMYAMQPGAYGRPPPQMPPMYSQHPAPAPRQRTAIACRYCRRRKIRCSGFENSEDGRCQNCTRFSQECIFTPVSAQQAFVPAHAVYRGGQAPHSGPMQLYGAYGQPLPTTAPPQEYRPQQAYHPGPSPAVSYPPMPQHGYAQAPATHEMPNGAYNRKRPSDEPHPASLPPPGPGTSRGERYAYPDPTGLAPAGAVSPASSSASYHSVPPQGNAAQPYYVNPPSAAAHTQPALQNIAERPRVSPSNSAHAYDANRASSSPNAAPQAAQDGNLRPPSTQPARNNGRTPPPRTSQDGGPGGRPAMSISSIVSGQQGSRNDEGASPGTRSTADSDMIKKLR